MSHAYIAHAPEDLDTLLEVHEALRKAGINDWYPPADRNTVTKAELQQRTDEAFAMIVLVSGPAMRARDVREDIERAQASGITLIPYRIDRARLSGLIRTRLAGDLKLDASEPGALEALVGETRRAYHRRCPVLAVMNLKGGVGKTTVASQVFGTWQGETGKRVLLVDLDPQYNLTQVFFDMDMADACAARDRSVISLLRRAGCMPAVCPRRPPTGRACRSSPSRPQRGVTWCMNCSGPAVRMGGSIWSRDNSRYRNMPSPRMPTRSARSSRISSQ